ncbi:PTS mannose/fructose/sorbose/N-acetylgalactosamine transporter subunit IIC [Vagococcus elongatus]|uniref:PTS sorbose transporter subunit IIC n=1 Tax=Vagococcus elongatus TaxID=180344 RepID=A0A430AZJ6_9ENTE|nr:PTS sugar transporter subunit IIC [Vagococcus elongatus]RSU13503.1 PTS sorbose transporter subunit IIC [Vagococcus elongatus]
MTTLLLTLWAFICGVDDATTQMLRRPLMICFVTGIIMGDIKQGLLIGATLEIMWMGIGNVGAYMAPDIVSGSIISCALAISSGGGIAVATTLAVPTSILAQQLLILWETINVSLNPWAQRLAENADVEGTNWLIYPPMLLIGFIRAAPTFIAIKFGSGAIQNIVDSLPTTLLDGLSASGKIIPAVGMALLMSVMIKEGKMWIYLILGFVLSSYLSLAVLPIALIALAFALLHDQSNHNGALKKQAAQTVVSDFSNEEEYDL